MPNKIIPYPALLPDAKTAGRTLMSHGIEIAHVSVVRWGESEMTIAMQDGDHKWQLNVPHVHEIASNIVLAFNALGVAVEYPGRP